MSNLSSAFGEGSTSSNHQLFASSASQNPNQARKKRNLPGNPDPDAEVIALSPKSLLATNRFVCEICNKGFQRDQNLQLHRRGHNLPWKLKQRSRDEVVRKKVYICPEVTCVHHDPSRALGDLTGIKKHFCRKHWEKKWKCERCNKKYAVQSDWKAHSKTCGTKEYRCGCGTLFSRRDSFVTHRAFCDALSDESARSVTLNPLTLHHHHPFLFSQPSASHDPIPHQSALRAHFPNTHVNAIGSSHGFQEFKREEEHLQPVQQMTSTIPAWVVQQVVSSQPMTSLPHMDLPSSIFPTRLVEHDIPEEGSSVVLPSPPSFQSTASPHMSATALLQRAAQMGATMSSNRHTQPDGHYAPSGLSSNMGFGLGLPSAEGNVSGFVNANANSTSPPPPPPLGLNDMVMASLASSAGFDRSFEDAYGGILGLKRDDNNGVTVVARRKEEVSAGSNIAGGGSDRFTRDFLGLRAFYHKDILNMAGMDQCMSSPYDQTQQMKKPWHG